MADGGDEAGAGVGSTGSNARFEAERRARLEAEALLAASRATITELQARLREAEAEREQAELAKTAFLANMSHEIRTPVSAVMGYANLIAAVESAGVETREWSDRLQRSAEHLLALLDDVLDLAKMDAGRLDLHLVSAEPSALLEEVGVLMEPRALDRGLELIVTSETELPVHILTDPLRLRQILVNLVGNALKYTEHGKVALQARTESSRSDPSRSVLVLDVVDTGQGIPEDELERIFEPFEQGRQKNGGGGVGLGLDIARRLARMLGGDIAVRSQLGVGSTFTLTLPLDPELGGETTPARVVTRSGALRPGPGEGGRLDERVILLVDDTADNRRIVAHFLTRSGARVIEASTLSGARTALEDDASIDLVLTDLQLPDGDGLELVEVARQRSERPPVVALTADAMIETRMRALSSGVDDFVLKPIVGARLVARLAAICNRLRGRVEPRQPMMRAPDPVPTEPAPRVSTLTQRRPQRGPPPDVPAALLQKFYAVLAERTYTVEDAIRSKDAARLREAAHRIAGTGGAMGHPELTELGREVEAAIAGPDPWERLEPLAQRFLTAVRHAATRRPWI